MQNALVSSAFLLYVPLSLAFLSWVVLTTVIESIFMEQKEEKKPKQTKPKQKLQLSENLF